MFRSTRKYREEVIAEISRQSTRAWQLFKMQLEIEQINMANNRKAQYKQSANFNETTGNCQRHFSNCFIEINRPQPYNKSAYIIFIRQRVLNQITGATNKRMDNSRSENILNVSA